MKARQANRGLRSRKGSASALIVLMVVLLTVFGALALTGAASDLRLASRHADWSVEYYRLDAEGERFLAAVSQTVLDGSGSKQDAETLASQIKAIELDGLYSVAGDVEGDRIVVRAVVGDPESSGIEITLEISILDSDTSVTRWAQFQKPFEYGTGPGGIWDGA